MLRKPNEAVSLEAGEPETSDAFVPSRIISQEGDGLDFRVRWVGFSAAEDTIEPAAHLTGVRNLWREFANRRMEDHLLALYRESRHLYVSADLCAPA